MFGNHLVGLRCGYCVKAVAWYVYSVGSGTDVVYSFVVKSESINDGELSA